MDEKVLPPQDPVIPTTTAPKQASCDLNSPGVTIPSQDEINSEVNCTNETNNDVVLHPVTQERQQVDIKNTAVELSMQETDTSIVCLPEENVNDKSDVIIPDKGDVPDLLGSEGTPLQQKLPENLCDEDLGANEYVGKSHDEPDEIQPPKESAATRPTVLAGVASTSSGLGGAAAASAEGAPSTSSPPKSPQTSAYHIKWIKWKGQKTPIVTQNENGPCPLIAIMNVLLLKRLVTFPPMIEIITASQLMEYLGDCMLENIPKNISVGAQLNFEQNMSDAMSVLPKLQTGLDVNVRFTGVSDFEYTPECIVFDLLRIPLYHGWLLDPEIPEVLAAVGSCSYNQLVEKIINNKCSSQPEIVTEALLAENFLERTASQLTYHGLCELNSTINEDELCVLFRNNHFITLYKHKNELFQLVTDQGFLTESSVVWESLNNIEGDGQFVDSDFIASPPKPPVALNVEMSKEQQIDQDYLVALSLQEEQEKQEAQRQRWEKYLDQEGYSNLTDEELAQRLQESESRRAQQGRNQHSHGSRSPGNGTPNNSINSKNKKGNCIII